MSPRFRRRLRDSASSSVTTLRSLQASSLQWGGGECRTFSGLTEAEMASLISEATIGTFFVILAKSNGEDRRFILGARINNSKILIGVMIGENSDYPSYGRVNATETALTYTTWNGNNYSLGANQFQGVMYPSTASELDTGGGLDGSWGACDDVTIPMAVVT